MTNAAPSGLLNTATDKAPGTEQSLPGISFVPAGLSFDAKTEAELNLLVSKFKEGELTLA